MHICEIYLIYPTLEMFFQFKRQNGGNGHQFIQEIRRFIMFDLCPGLRLLSLPKQRQRCHGGVELAEMRGGGAGERAPVRKVGT